MTRGERVSVVIPVFNEKGSLEKLHAELVAVLSSMEVDFEILFVDDGSNDGSLDVMRAICAQDNRVKAISFRSNQGKAEALNAGFRAVTGSIVVTMDADLQDVPAELPKLVTALEESDLVSGWKQRRHDPPSKTLPSRFFNFVTRLASGVPLHDFNCGYKAYRRPVVEELDLYGEMHRFIPVIAARRGFRVTEVPVEHAARAWGHSKYGATRLIKGAYDLLTVILITRFEHRPLHLFGSFGLLFGAAGFVILAYMSYLRLMRDEVIGTRPLLLLGVLLMLTGIHLVSAGLVGELVVRRTRGVRHPPPQVITHSRENIPDDHGPGDA